MDSKNNIIALNVHFERLSLYKSTYKLQCTFTIDNIDTAFNNQSFETIASKNYTWEHITFTNDDINDISNVNSIIDYKTLDKLFMTIYMQFNSFINEL